MTDYMKKFNRQLEERYNKRIVEYTYKFYKAVATNDNEKTSLYRDVLRTMTKRRDIMHAFNNVC